MKLTVLQWNVWYEENIENVLTFLNTHKADIICLQELTKGYIKQTQENTWEYLAHHLNYYCHYKDIQINTAEAQWSQANAIFSKYPIIRQSATWLHEPKDENGYEDQFRAYIEATINVGNSDVTIGTTHMSHTDKFSATAKKDEELNRLLDLLKSKKKNYIFTGDLNSLPDSNTINEISKLLIHSGPNYDVNTWTTKPIKYNGFEAKSLDWRLDYIFTSKDIKTIESKTILTDVSDHLPIYSVLEIESD